MSHGFTKSDRMIYVGDKPWHDVGTDVAAMLASIGPDDAIREAARLAGIDGELTLVQNSLGNPYTGKWEQLQSWSVVRKADGQVIAPHVGKIFRVQQTVDTLERVLAPVLKAGLATIETAGSIRSGGRVWMMLKCKVPSAQIVPGDHVQLYLFVAMGHDGSFSIRPGFTGVRIVCQNTMAAALAGDAIMKVRHTKSAPEALTAAGDAVMKAAGNFDKAAELFRALASKPVTEKAIRAMVDRIFPPAKRDAAPAPEVQAAMDEWTDEATSPDVTTAAPAADFGSLLAKPVASTAIVNGRSDVAAVLRSTKPADDSRRVADNIVEIFEKGGQRGDLNLPGVKGTAWGAYNAVTEYLTWHRGANAENRMNTLYFQDPGINARALQAASDTFLG